MKFIIIRVQRFILNVYIHRIHISCFLCKIKYFRILNTCTCYSPYTLIHESTRSNPDYYLSTCVISFFRFPGIDTKQNQWIAFLSTLYDDNFLFKHTWMKIPRSVKSDPTLNSAQLTQIPTLLTFAARTTPEPSRANFCHVRFTPAEFGWRGGHRSRECWRTKVDSYKSLSTFAT